MLLKQELNEPSDLICCPITSQIIRHPVLASDGRHYELIALHEWLILNNREQSPISFLPISTVIYDKVLKKKLDECNPSGRHEDYDMEAMLSALVTKINPKPSLPLMTSLTRSAATINIALFAFFLFEDPNLQVDRSHWILSIMLIALSDYSIRYCSKNRYSLFTVLDLVSEEINSRVSKSKCCAFWG